MTKKGSAKPGRRNHSDEFKAKVALAALREDKTMAQVCAQFSVHMTQVNLWKSELLNNASLAFAKSGVIRSEIDVTPLLAKIDELTLENDFFSARIYQTEKSGIAELKFGNCGDDRLNFISVARATHFQASPTIEH